MDFIVDNSVDLWSVLQQKGFCLGMSADTSGAYYIAQYNGDLVHLGIRDMYSRAALGEMYAECINYLQKVEE